MDRDQAPRNLGPDLRPKLFDTQHQFLRRTCFALNSEDIEILSILQNVPELVEGTRSIGFTFLILYLNLYISSMDNLSRARDYLNTKADSIKRFIAFLHSDSYCGDFQKKN